jgi:spore maturation protein CgeB
MKYSFIRIGTLYNDVLEAHYKDATPSEYGTYETMHQNLMDKYYGIFDGYERSLQKIFGIASNVIVANDKRLQTKWAEEHHSSFDGYALILEQLIFYKPTVVMIEDLFWADEGFIVAIKNLSFVKVVCGHHCSPHSPQTLARMRLLNFVISCSPLLVDTYKSLGIKNTYLIYHAFDPSILERLKGQNQKTIDLTFTGSFLLEPEGHNTRAEIIFELIKADVALNIYADSPAYSGKPKAKYIFYSYLKKFMGENQVNIFLGRMRWKESFIEQKFWTTVRPFLFSPVYGLTMYNTLLNSRLVLNNHGAIAGNFAANMRLFEVTGVGSCLVTDDKSNMEDLFKPDIECVTYRNAEDAREKITWLLKNPKAREAIAKAGQARCIKDHSYDVRVSLLNDIILQHLR